MKEPTWNPTCYCRGGLKAILEGKQGGMCDMCEGQPIATYTNYICKCYSC